VGRRTRNRWIARAAICLVTGFVLSVVVSWACMLWVDFPAVPPGPAPVSIANPVWPRRVPQDWPAKPDRAIPCATAFLSGWVSESRQPGKVPGRDNIWSQQVIGAGWPLSPLEMEFQGVGSVGGTFKMTWLGEWKPEVLLSLRPLSPDRARLPLRPNWAGLVVDVLAWGLMWYATAFLWSDVRHWRRLRHGRCVRCGYDLSGLNPGLACPECGST